MRPRIAEKRCVAAAVMFALGAGSQMGETALSSWQIWVQLNDVANADWTFGFFWLNPSLIVLSVILSMTD